MKDVGTWVKLNAPTHLGGWGNKKDSTNNFNLIGWKITWHDIIQNVLRCTWIITWKI